MGILDGLLDNFKEQQPDALLERCRYQERLVTGLLKLLAAKNLISVSEAQTLIKSAKKD